MFSIANIFGVSCLRGKLMGLFTFPDPTHPFPVQIHCPRGSKAPEKYVNKLVTADQVLLCCLPRLLLLTLCFLLKWHLRLLSNFWGVRFKH